VFFEDAGGVPVRIYESKKRPAPPQQESASRQLEDYLAVSASKKASARKQSPYTKTFVEEAPKTTTESEEGKQTFSPPSRQH